MKIHIKRTELGATEVMDVAVILIKGNIMTYVEDGEEPVSIYPKDCYEIWIKKY